MQGLTGSVRAVGLSQEARRVLQEGVALAAVCRVDGRGQVFGAESRGKEGVGILGQGRDGGKGGN